MRFMPSPPEPKEIIAPETEANRALVAAARKNDPEAVRAAFAQGASPNVTVAYELSYSEPPGYSLPEPTPALAIAASQGSEEAERARAVAIFHEFLRRGFDVRLQGNGGENAVFWAARLEDAELLKAVLDEGADVHAVANRCFYSGNIVNWVVMLTLHLNESPNLPLLQMVLERGTDPNVYDQLGMTPLHAAANQGMPRTTELLLRYGADPNLPMREPDEPLSYRVPPGTPLLLALRNGNEEGIRLLLAAKPNLTPVEAAAVGSAAALRKHLNHGAVDANHIDEAGMPLIVLAAASGDPETVRLLLERGADPNATHAASGTTALHRAAGLGHVEAARALLDGGADPNATKGRERVRETPLTLAVREAEAEMVALLLERGVDLSAPVNRGALLVMIQEAGKGGQRVVGKSPNAVKRGNERFRAQGLIYTQLVARMDISTIGSPALCMAVAYEQYDIARDLIARGVDINARDSSGMTVTMLVVDRIGQNHTPFEIGENDWESPPLEQWKTGMSEAGAKATEFLRFLLEKKPDLNARNAETANLYTHMGRTALEAARFWKLDDVAALLQQAGARE